MRFNKTRKLLVEELNIRFGDSTYYHNTAHALEVESYVVEISEVEGINDLELELLRIAALTHDIGHYITYINHEKLACDFIEEKLPPLGYSKNEIDIISSLIMATKFPHNPSGKLEEIICDADLAYLGTEVYYKHAKRLRNEFKEVQERTVLSDKEWIQFQLNFLNTHRYYRIYSKEQFDKNKNNIIKDLTEKLNKL